MMAPSKEMDRPGKIIVTGIPKEENFTEADLEKLFAPFGRITEVVVVKNRRTDRSRGYGFITYENPQDSFDAMKAMEGKDLGGNKSLHCEQAVLGTKMLQDDDSKGIRGRERGGGPGRGRDGPRGGRGAENRGRGDGMRGRGEGMRGRGDGFRGRGDGFRGRGDGMRGRDGFRGRGSDFRGGDNGYRGGFRGGLMGGGGRGGEYFEEEYRMDEHQMHGFEEFPGPQRRGLMGDRFRGGRGGRMPLLPDPDVMGNRRGGQPPPFGHYDEGEEYYNEAGGEHYGAGRGYEERYDEGYGDEHYNEYYEQEEYREHYEDRGPPMRGGARGRGGMQPPRRGGPTGRGEMESTGRGVEPPKRGGMESSRRGGLEAQRRGDMDSQRRGLMDPSRRGGMEPPARGDLSEPPSRRALMDIPRRGGLEPLARGGMSESSRRGGMPPRRRGPEFLEDQEMRRAQRYDEGYGRLAEEEEGGRGRPSQDQWKSQQRHQDDYGYPEEGQGHLDGGYWDSEFREEMPTQSGAGRGPRGRSAPGRGGRRPLLGADPYSGGDAGRDQHGRQLPAEMGREAYEDEEHFNRPHGRRPPRSQPDRSDERYREDGGDGGMMHGVGAARGRRLPPGGERDRYEGEGYLEDGMPPGPNRQEGYGEDRRYMDRAEEGYPPHRRPANYPPSREPEFEHPGHKRHLEEEGHRFDEVHAFRRQYDNLMDRGRPGGPPAPKRDRYDGYHQGQEAPFY